MKSLSYMFFSIALAGCGSTELSPETKANIERNKVDPANAVSVSAEGGPIIITVNNSRKVAMVRGRPGVHTISQLERAVARHTGCKTGFPTNVPIEKNVPLTSGNTGRYGYGQFGGQVPILLTC